MARPLKNVAASEPMYRPEDEDLQYEEEEEEVEDLVGVAISAAEARSNYRECGELVEEDEETIKWVDHQQYFDQETAILLKRIHEKHGAPYKLRESQEVALHVLGAQKNLFMVAGTGTN